MKSIKPTYTTNEVAKLIGVHVNTVRLYEKSGFMTKPLRKENGYRVFTDLHINQLRIVRLGIEVVIMQNGIRKKAYDIIHHSGLCEFDRALELAHQYVEKIDSELNNAYEAIKISEALLNQSPPLGDARLLRHEVSMLLNVSMDALRNWERNGLLKTKRKENGYRVYREDDIQRLKIIRTLRCANYSLTAILRMLNDTDKNSTTNISAVLDAPANNEEIISACDKLITSLNHAKTNALEIIKILEELTKENVNPTR